MWSRRLGYIIIVRIIRLSPHEQFDSSNGSVWTGPAAWTFSSTPGANMVIGGGYSASAVAGQTASRSATIWNGAVMVSIRLQ